MNEQCCGKVKLNRVLEIPGFAQYFCCVHFDPLMKKVYLIINCLSKL